MTADDGALAVTATFVFGLCLVAFAPSLAAWVLRIWERFHPASLKAFNRALGDRGDE